MATKVSICSNALLLIGDSPINDFQVVGVDQDRVTLVSNLWEYTKDAMIRAHNWSCCVKRVQLTHTVDGPAWGNKSEYQYAFELPGDCLRVLSVWPNQTPISHVVEGQQILCNETPIYLRYIFRNDIVESWDAGLVDVMTSAMAAACAYPIKQSGDLKDRFDREVFVKLRNARARDSTQSTQLGITDSPLTQVRGIGGGY
jgi:hypothetical protein